MGVPKFYRWLSERYPCLSEVVKEYQLPEFDNLYLDMNGIIHNCSHPNDEDPHFRITEQKIFEDIFHYIEVLFRMIKPKEVFFMAVDGVAPRAKMNQQRGRRFRSAKEAEVLEADAIKRGEKLPTDKRFDSNCITPGTDFMARLHAQLQYFVASKVSTDALWQGVTVYLSGHQTPGEGEHKIMQYIRWSRSQPGFDKNTRHCLYGLDADLIMLGLCTHQAHFSLLREEIRFGGKRSKQRVQAPEETTFHLLHLSLLRDYLQWEFDDLRKPGQLPFPYSLDSVVDDWVLMGFLVGNDFIPNLPDMHIVHGALPLLYKAYTKVLPTLDGYLNEGGRLNLARFQKFLEYISTSDMEKFEESYADLTFLKSKKTRGGYKSRRRRGEEAEEFDVDEEAEETWRIDPEHMNPDLAALIHDTDESYGTEEDDEKTLMETEFIHHKTHYYKDKLKYEEVTEEVLESQALGYVRAVQWILSYYYEGVCSWSWYYPHHYAPFVSDVKGFADTTINFDMGKPFLPFEQLLAVLPAASKQFLPAPMQDLMTSQTSPIISYYPEEFVSDLNGKQQEWEAVVLIPFIDEKCLLAAMAPLLPDLTDEENIRNSHGPMHIYTHTFQDMGILQAPSYFPPIEPVHAIKEDVELTKFDITWERLFSLLSVKEEHEQRRAFFPRFPTLDHIPHKGELDTAKVAVFDYPSRYENMVLTVVEQGKPPVQEVAQNMLGKEAFVQWPHFTTALVVGVSSAQRRFFLRDDGTTEEITLEGKTAEIWKNQSKGIGSRYMSRFGIDIGPIHVILYCRLLVGSKQVFNTSLKRVVEEKEWNPVVISCAIQTSVRELPQLKVKSTKAQAEVTCLSEMFPEGSQCFLLGQPMYGGLATVLGVDEIKCRIHVSVLMEDEPQLDTVRQEYYEPRDRYVTGNIASQRVAMSSHMLSRLTGTIYVVLPGSDQKYNIGLNLKFNKKNEQVPGFTRKTHDGSQWLYSSRAIQLINEYQDRFFDMMEILCQNVSRDFINAKELFPKGDSKEKLMEVISWLKAQDHVSAGRVSCGLETLDGNAIDLLTEVVDEWVKNRRPESIGSKKMNVKQHVLYKSNLQTGNVIPDPKASSYRILDRVICVKEGLAVPMGLKGTVIGLSNTPASEDQSLKLPELPIIHVAFDKPFTGGMLLSGECRSYRLPITSVLNINLGSIQGKKERSFVEQRTIPKPLAVVYPQDQGVFAIPVSPRERRGNRRSNTPPRMQRQLRQNHDERQEADGPQRKILQRAVNQVAVQNIENPARNPGSHSNRDSTRSQEDVRLSPNNRSNTQNRESRRPETSNVEVSPRIRGNSGSRDALLGLDEFDVSGNRKPTVNTFNESPTRNRGNSKNGVYGLEELSASLQSFGFGGPTMPNSFGTPPPPFLQQPGLNPPPWFNFLNQFPPPPTPTTRVFTAPQRATGPPPKEFEAFWNSMSRLEQDGSQPKSPSVRADMNNKSSGVVGQMSGVEFIQRARELEQKESESSLTEEEKEHAVLTLVNRLREAGLSTPQYTYVPIGQGFQARCQLPTGAVFLGLPGRNKEEASISAALKALICLDDGTIPLNHEIYSDPPPPPFALPSPPDDWRGSCGRGKPRHHMKNQPKTPFVPLQVTRNLSHSNEPRGFATSSGLTTQQQLENLQKNAKAGESQQHKPQGKNKPPEPEMKKKPRIAARFSNPPPT